MKILVRDFYSIKYAELDISPGVSALAGKNGAGKTQLFVAIASKGRDPNTLQQLGYTPADCANSIVEVDARTLLRPSLRRIGEATRGSKYATSGPTPYLDLERGQGYRWSLDERFTQLHGRLANLFIAGALADGDAKSAAKWSALRTMFKDAFGRTLRGTVDGSNGPAITVELPGGAVAHFPTLSTGELEFLALGCDVLVEESIDLFLTDELDAHFHPDLQRRVIEIIEPYVGERHLLISTHSPMVMLSVKPERVFFMEPPSVLEAAKNQVTTFGDDLTLFESVADLYPGFVEDTRLAARMRSVGEKEVLRFAIECLSPSEVVAGDRAKDADPQTSAIRARLLAGDGARTVIEVGAGAGRLLQAYETLDRATLKQISYTAIDRDEKELAKLKNFADGKDLPARLGGFAIRETLPVDASADLILAPNMVHEVGPEKLAAFLTKVLGTAKVGGSILILEQGELGRGEEGYVVFDGPALKALFARIEAEGYVRTAFSTPHSHGGTPLLEYNVSVAKGGGKIRDREVIDALDVVINSGGSLT